MYLNPQDDFQRLDTAMDAAGLAWWEMELPSGVVFFAENKAKMLGYEAENFFHYKSFTDLLHPDDYPIAMKAMQDHLDGKIDIYETRYRIKCKDGEYKTFYDRGKIVQKKGKNVRVAGIVLDITNLEGFLEPKT